MLTGGELVLYSDIEDARSDISCRSRKHSELILMSWFKETGGLKWPELE